jgi:hypothetical protein
MNEATWLGCTDPTPMLEFLGDKADGRKLRLFAVACCRRVWPFLMDARSRNAVEVSEMFWDGLASEKDLGEAHKEWAQVAQDPAYADAPPYSAVHAIEHARIAACWASALPSNKAVKAAAQAAGHAGVAGALLGWNLGRNNWLPELTRRGASEKGAQARLLHDLFGHLPFRPLLPLAPSLLVWQDGLIVRLAEAVYENRILPSGHFDRDRVAVLADALEDAGCTDAEILWHLRGPGPHVRGCHIVDLLLSNE